MNVAFVEAEKLFPEINCVMFHDVDHLLEDDRMLMNCGKTPRHFAFNLDEWNYRCAILLMSSAISVISASGSGVDQRVDLERASANFSFNYHSNSHT